MVPACPLVVLGIITDVTAPEQTRGSVPGSSQRIDEAVHVVALHEQGGSVVHHEFRRRASALEHGRRSAWRTTDSDAGVPSRVDGRREMDSIRATGTDLRKNGVNRTTRRPSRTTIESVCVAALSPSAMPTLGAAITTLASTPLRAHNDGIEATRPAALPAATMMPRITTELGARWRSRNRGKTPPLR